MGRLDEACLAADRAVRLDPGSVVVNHMASLPFLFAHRYEQALEYSQRALDIEPEASQPYWSMSLSHSALADHEQAIATARKGLNVADGSVLWVGILGCVLASAGREDEARQALRDLDERSHLGYVDPTLQGFIHACLGEADLFFECLERAYDVRSCILSHVTGMPGLERYRKDPRYRDLMNRMGLPGLPQES